LAAGTGFLTFVISFVTNSSSIHIKHPCVFLKITDFTLPEEMCNILPLQHNSRYTIQPKCELRITQYTIVK
jgi:hypothetical protein